MSQQPETYGLQCPDGRQAQLLSVQVHAELLGLMLRLTVRQTWRNASGAPMATRLRFPLATDQTLLDLQMERPQGSQTLDKVWRESRTCCSATPGVLGTGEQVTLHWRIGQLLNLQGSSLRLQLPAALVPRAPRPALVQLEVREPVAQGTVSCPSHDMHKVRHANGMTLSLRPAAGLDKDLVLTVHGLRNTGFALASADVAHPGQCTVLMSASPLLTTAAPQPLRMKLLVDSSSAMPAERLSSIRSALDRLLTHLQPEDQLSYSRFGERTVHELPRLQVCTEAYQRRVRALARHTDTDMGAAQPLLALMAALAIPNEDEEAVTQADLLLITASPLWEIGEPLRALRAADHRLHVMALGEAATSLWPELAQASGGHCERLEPGQHSQQTLARLMERMRQQQALQTQLVLTGAQMHKPQPQQRLHSDGDTLHLWAQATPQMAAHDLAGHPQLQAQLQWHGLGQDLAEHGPAQTLTAHAVLWDEQGDLSRLCAAQDALLLADDAEHKACLVRHHLIEPNLSRVAAAVAAQAKPSEQHKAVAERRSTSQPTSPPATALPRPVQASAHSAPARRHTDLAGWLTEAHTPGHPLVVLVQQFNTQAKQYPQFRPALSTTLRQVSARFLDGLVMHLSRQAGNPARVWAMLLYWLHAEHGFSLQTQALDLIEHELASVPVTARTQVHAALDHAASAVATVRQAA